MDPSRFGFHGDAGDGSGFWNIMLYNVLYIYVWNIVGINLWEYIYINASCYLESSGNSRNVAK
jgi:hypothetical protein